MGGFLSPKARRTAKGVFLAFEKDELHDEDLLTIIASNDGKERSKKFNEKVNANTFEEFLEGWGNVGEVADRMTEFFITQTISTWGESIKDISWLKSQLPTSEHRHIDSPSQRLADDDIATATVIQQMCGRSPTALRAFCRLCKCEPHSTTETTEPIVADILPTEVVQLQPAHAECQSPDENNENDILVEDSNNVCLEQQADPVEEPPNDNIITSVDVVMEESDLIKEEQAARERLLLRMNGCDRGSEIKTETDISVSEIRNTVAHLSSLRQTLEGIRVNQSLNISYNESKRSDAYFASPPLPFKVEDNQHLYRDSVESVVCAPPYLPPQTQQYQNSSQCRSVAYLPPERNVTHSSKPANKHLSYVVSEAKRLSHSSKQKRGNKIPFTLSS